ncbi:hypothetical protein AB0N99_30460 [Streptomyces sp. NPDC093272]|uniref:hypothetical protein n=1 Tax=Streptomyces sp. NPDC093272 TaxID=3154981 RepID=UPI003436F439
MMHIDVDPALAEVIELVRRKYAPVGHALAGQRDVELGELAALAGSVGALLNAIDARRTPPPARTLAAVA